MRAPGFKGPFILWMISTLLFASSAFYIVARSLAAVTSNCVVPKTLIVLLCSYPFLFCVDRGNFESTIFLGLSAAIFLYVAGNFRASAILLGLVIGAKPYAVVFLPLFASDRKFKEILVHRPDGPLADVFRRLLPCRATGTTNLSRLTRTWRLTPTSTCSVTRQSTSARACTGLLKVFLFSNPALFHNAEFTRMMPVWLMGYYFYFSAASFLLVAIVVCGFQMPIWKKVSLLVCCMNLLPFVCGDYRLIHFVIPLLLFLREREAGWGDGFFASTFALLLIPKHYFHFSLNPAIKIVYPKSLEISDSVVVNPLMMILLLTGVCISVLRHPQISDTLSWTLAEFRRITGMERA